jgi:hypothetical protein
MTMGRRRLSDEMPRREVNGRGRIALSALSLVYIIASLLSRCKTHSSHSAEGSVAGKRSAVAIVINLCMKKRGMR